MKMPQVVQAYFAMHDVLCRTLDIIVKLLLTSHETKYKMYQDKKKMLLPGVVGVSFYPPKCKRKGTKEMFWC